MFKKEQKSRKFIEEGKNMNSSPPFPLYESFSIQPLPFWASSESVRVSLENILRNHDSLVGSRPNNYHIQSSECPKFVRLQSQKDYDHVQNLNPQISEQVHIDCFLDQGKMICHVFQSPNVIKKIKR